MAVWGNLRVIVSCLDGLDKRFSFGLMLLLLSSHRTLLFLDEYACSQTGRCQRTSCDHRMVASSYTRCAARNGRLDKCGISPDCRH